MLQKSPKMPENSKNDCLDLNMSMGNLSGDGKMMIKSKIQISKILTPFVTSQTPKNDQNGPKIT